MNEQQMDNQQMQNLIDSFFIQTWRPWMENDAIVLHELLEIAYRQGIIDQANGGVK